MAQRKNIYNDNRICYVDPNDVRGDINEAPLTPDYTEFSIWCNLIVEHTSRLKNQLNGKSEDENEKSVISFDMSTADNGTNFVSFMQGKDADRYNFLTTDYTNIDFNTVKERNIIEGLQIESINISFVNYQTPQVTIKFIDIRGGGFFGREEATHDEYGHLSGLETNERNQKIDNLFSCFVSFPYPRFRLQVKGFYGKPVTFQLTCTSFNGNFNSSTGNFEIVVQFIGYEYGMLGDIPFDLLVAAPLTETGGEYWDEHVADMLNNKWCLDKEETEAPCKLYDFYRNIAKELECSSEQELNDSIVDDEIETSMLSINEQINRLNEISQYITFFKQSLINIFKQDYVTECVNNSEDVMIIYSTTELFSIYNELCEKYNRLSELVTNYNKDYKELDGGISTTLIPNLTYDKDGKPKKWEPRQIRFTKFIEHKTDSSNILVTLNASNKVLNLPIVSQSSCCDFKIKKMYSNEWYTISPGVSKKIYEDLSNRNWALYGKDTNTQHSFASYALAIDFGNAVEEIDKKISGLKNSYNETKMSVNEPKGRTIKDIVGFSPFVGRYFKVVMCHLETLVYIFNHYADSIYGEILNGRRKPQVLGIKNLDIETDVPSMTYSDVPPFPAVYKEYTTKDEADKDLNDKDTVKAKTWVGDFNGDWLEEKMVDEIYKAAQRISESREVMSEVAPKLSGTCDSVMPVDFYYGIPNYAYNTINGAIFYAAIRAEIALNLMQGGNKITTNDAEILGCYDGYIFAKHTTNKAFIKTLSNDDDFYKHLYDSCVYTNGFKTHETFSYEFTKVHEDRQPVFIEENGNVKYNYMTNTTTDTEYIPLENHNGFEGVNGFSKYYDYVSGKDFTPKEDSGYFLASGAYSNSYLNTHHFGVILNEKDIEKIDDNYSNITSGRVEIGGKSPSAIVRVIDRHMHISDQEYRSNFYDNKNEEFYKSYVDYGIEPGNLSTYSYKKFYDSKNPTIVVNTTQNNVTQNYNSNGLINFTTGAETQQETVQPPFLPTETDSSNYPYIHTSSIKTVSASGQMKESNLFSHPFYYHQNSIADVKTRNSVKALLFLHSLPFAYEKLKVSAFKSFYNSDTCGGIDRVPYGYLLFLGGLIWRKNYATIHDEDPINYKDSFQETPTKDAPLFTSTKDGRIKFSCVLSSSSTAQKTNYYYYKYSDFFNNSNNPCIENYLLKMFNDFVDNDFPNIISHCELNKIDASDKKVKDLDYSDINFIARKLKGRNLEQSISLLEGNEEIQRTDGNHMKFKVNNFKGNYICGWSHDGEISSTYDVVIQTFYSEENSIQEIFRNLFFKEAITTTIPNKISTNGVQQQLLRNYFNGYIKSITKYANDEENKAEINEGEKNVKDAEHDLKCEIYLNLKNIWDRWLCGYYNQYDKANDIPGRQYFEVKNFFCKNFMFIDSFYNNIYDKLRLNCSRLKDEYMGGETHNSKLGKTTVAHLGNVVSHHRCVMFNFPDNINFSDTGDRLTTKEDYMVQNMKDLFTPMASNKVENPEYHNKFTIIYTRSAEALINTNARAKFNADSFDIWSYEDGTGVAPSVFKNSSIEMDNNENAVTNEAIESYKVPSFGVAYSRQNNSFWKNINVGMENFSVTEQSIRAEAYIAEKGNSEKRNITYYGQDTYSLYQAYSYIVTVEMMGDAQIQPLMYFQLMNVPMFRGTYLIIKVEHHITQGNMITSFSGMKMSKVQVPFTTSWFTVSNDEDYVDSNQDESSNGEEMTATDGTEIDIEDNELSIAIKKYLGTDGMLCDDFVMKVYNELGVKINNKLN